MTEINQKEKLENKEGIIDYKNMTREARLIYALMNLGLTSISIVCTLLFIETGDENYLQERDCIPPSAQERERIDMTIIDELGKLAQVVGVDDTFETERQIFESIMKDQK